MRIGDMLNIVGVLPLSTFEWGEALVKLCNEHMAEHVVSKTQLLTVTSTGEQLRSALYRLPAVELARFILLDFDPGSQTILTEEPATPVAGNVCCEVPAADLFPPEPTEVLQPIEAIQNLPPAAKSRIALFMGGFLVLIALLLAVSMSATTVKDGQMPDGEALSSVLSILAEVVKAYFSPTPPQELFRF